jgi:hypothetical protein
MIIRNLTFGEKAQNIMITSLRNEYLKEDYAIPPGHYMDTDIYNFSDTKVVKSQEIKMLEKQGFIGLFRSLEEEKEKRGDSIKKQQDW